ncbi:MAG: hypothetical protein KAQ98_08090 [Bacteriovoracaceae bacterium]|nr:hypothetical protein [Bacteriovoracaceae bacterium]
MNKIIVIRNSEHLETYFSTFNEVLSDFDGELVLIPFKNPQKTSKYVNQRKNLFIIEFQGLNSTAKLISDFFNEETGHLYIAAHMDTLCGDDREEFKALLLSEKKILGLIDTSLDIEFYAPFFRSQFEYIKSGNNIVELKRIGKNLNRLTCNTISELQRIKNLHEQIVPVRSDNIKGVKLLSKYAAGEKPGGDFFDLIHGNQEFTLLLTSSSSHVISSIVLAHFEALKQKKNPGLQEIEQFIQDVESELKTLELLKDKKERLNFFLGRFDLKKFEVEGFLFGKFELISSETKKYFAGNEYPFGIGFLNQAKINISLERGEKIIILSPGIRYNANDLLGNKDMVCFVRELLALEGKEVLTELYYQLQKDQTNEFMRYDASAIFIEVDKNVIMQV